MKFLNPLSLLLALFALVLMFKEHLAVVDVVELDDLGGRKELAKLWCNEIPCLNNDDCAKQTDAKGRSCLMSKLYYYVLD